MWFFFYYTYVLSIKSPDTFPLLGLSARVIDETKSMSDVYTAFYEFSLLLESKVCYAIVIFATPNMEYSCHLWLEHHNICGIPL
jgi:hypothetical protein